MKSIPKEPFMLLSFLNMKLRDQFYNLEEFSLFYQVNQNEIIKKMDSINYFYDEKSNQFKVKI